MAGILREYGVMVGLALALVMSPPAAGEAGSETRGHAISGEEQDWNVAANRMDTDARSHLSNPIRMPTEDGMKEVSFGAEVSSHSAQKPTADMAMPRNEKAAAAPADGPSASESTGLRASLLMCAGMALLSLVVA